MRRNLTGVSSGPSYAGALSSAVVDVGTGVLTDVCCGYYDLDTACETLVASSMSC